MCIVARVRFMPYGEETEDYYRVYCIYIDYPCIQLLLLLYGYCFICDTFIDWLSLWQLESGFSKILKIPPVSL